jgi:hypothetical protein
VKLDDAPWKNDPVSPIDPDLRVSQARSRQFMGTDERDTDAVPPPAAHRHEQLLKVLAGLDSSVTKLESRLDDVLVPERPQPTNGDVQGGTEDREYISVTQQRHDLIFQALLRLNIKVESIIDRVDL